MVRVEQNAHAEAIEEFYAEGASMREKQAAPRVGRDVLVANEQGHGTGAVGKIELHPAGIGQWR